MANHGSASTIQMPVSLEQLATALRQLPPSKVEGLEMLLDQDFAKIVLARAKTARRHRQKGQTLSLARLQKEF